MKIRKYVLGLVALIMMMPLPILAQNSRSSNSSTHDGPFGFYRGMTQEQVLALLGNAAVVKRTPDRMSVSTAPKPHSDFELYSLLFSPKEGLLKIVAYGRTIPNDPSGYGMREQFDKVKTALRGTYGVSKDYDYLHAGALWKEPEEFMMAIHKEERVLSSYWNLKGNTNRIFLINLEGAGLNRTDGYLILTYEFEGWNQYVDERDAKQNSVF